MKKPTKKQGIIAGMAVIIICAGGWIWMNHDDEEKNPKTNAVVVHDVKPTIDKAVKEKEQEEKKQQEKEKKEKEQKQKEEAKKQEEAQKEVVQSIAPEPVVPQEETVHTPPVQQQTLPSTENNGSNNESHEGMIWVDGFGWVEDEGGGSEGDDAPDMVPNGNQIGEMN